MTLYFVDTGPYHYTIPCEVFSTREAAEGYADMVQQNDVMAYYGAEVSIRECEL